MSRSFTNINVNPCKMCMPMGAVTAFKGIEGAMVILHGSQGCSTYIRRHMATHFNEPIDIASSSLNEEGTVYGGAENLKKGIKNMVKLYEPRVIGIFTTCLAETIGEDINGITEEFKEEESSLKDIDIITVSTPGYGGSQYEGYFRALRNVVQALCKPKERNGKINIILPALNPGDVRHLKEILEDFGIEYTLLPDISETLDAPFSNVYKRIPEGGTKPEDIARMPGAAATIEFAPSLDNRLSPGYYLNERFGVPLYRLPLPLGLNNNDAFFTLLSELGRKPTPDKYVKQRGRLLDAMIDAHKYNAEIRAAIYGEPEYCYALTKFCLENGIRPKLIAAGTENRLMKEKIRKLYRHTEDYPTILDDTDFETIEKLVLNLDVNMLIGNSDGRRIEEKHKIKLVRVGFPVHDRLGAQRKVILGYEGTMALIDETSNSVLAGKEAGYREEMYERYYKEVKKNEVEALPAHSIEEKTAQHPCFSREAHNMARMHIPVAPACNISCNYCSRKYDCPNESRPGVTSEVLTPEQAVEKFKLVKSRVPNLKVIGIAGPGDALANFEAVKRSIELISKEDSEITFCLSTNGLMLPFHAEELITLGVSHVTVTINTIDPEIGAKLYKEVNYLGTTYKGREAAEILLHNQLSGLRYLSSRGVVCKVNIVMVKGVNDEKIPEVVKKIKECGAFITNIMQMIPAPGSTFEKMPLVSQLELNEMRKSCEPDLNQMYHCRQCRADAIGTLAQDRSIEFRCGGCSNINLEKKESIKPEAKEEKDSLMRIAVASKSGINIDQHFGYAKEFYIYEYTEAGIKFKEKREVEKYCTGKEDCGEEDKITNILNAIRDCRAVLAMRAGDEPVRKLREEGIIVYQMYESIFRGIERVMAQK
ncbi:MAG: nitrogenase cofactor biosynthesis protein NifB [Bacillota bacterium]|nr:nitrogenase cofactor biosynthesis protein NifB [Bacillota bacterium]